MNKKYLIGVLIIIAVIIGVFVLSSSEKETDNQQTSSQVPTPVASITHAHGLAVDVTDKSKVYIATHHGLLVLQNDKDLYQIGNKKDDYMGFSPHPSDPKVFFTSGHPSFGGNLGFQKSEDGGLTWKKVSNGVEGPVDFHAMSVSPANPNLIYGWFRGKIQRSNDGGKNWDVFTTDFVIVSLVADPKEENVVYATTPQGQGIMVSKNKGQDWQPLSEELKGGIVSSLAIHPQDSQIMLSFSEKLKLAKSSDGGKTWQKVEESFNGEEILFMVFTKQEPTIVYALTHTNSLYKSTDGGNAWSKTRS